MHVAVYLPLLASVGVAALLLPSAARRWADHVAPSVVAVVLAASMAVLALAGVTGLALLTAAVAEEFTPAGRGGRLVAPPALDVPVAAPVGGLAAVALAVLAWRLTATCLRLWCQYRAREPVGVAAGDGVIVVGGTRPFAHARPARGRRGGVIVVSEPLLTHLRSEEARAMLAHERAHLDGRHHLFLAVAAVATALNPLLARARSDLAFALERSADAAAARTTGSRVLVARAIGRAALVGAGAASDRRASLVAGAATGPVPRRVEALLGPSRAGVHWSWLGIVVVAVVALAAGAAAVHAVVDFGELVRLEGRTP